MRTNNGNDGTKTTQSNTRNTLRMIFQKEKKSKRKKNMHRIKKNEMNIQKQSTHHSRLNKHVKMDLFLLRIQKQQQILLVSSDLDALTKCNSFAVNIDMPCVLKTSDYVCVCVWS